MSTQPTAASPRIRPATAGDLPAILQIVNQAIATTTADWNIAPQTLEERAAWFTSRQQAGFPVLVAERPDGTLIGWASYGPFREREGYATTVEHSVYVTEQARGTGAGSALLEALIEHARAAGKHVMVGGLDGENHASLRFHARHGFVIVGRMPEVGRKFDRWLELVLVQRTIDQPGSSSSGAAADSPPTTS